MNEKKGQKHKKVYYFFQKVDVIIISTYKITVKRILIRFFKDTISLEISDLNLNEKKLNSDYQLNEQSPLILNH